MTQMAFATLMQFSGRASCGQPGGLEGGPMSEEVLLAGFIVGACDRLVAYLKQLEGSVCFEEAKEA